MSQIPELDGYTAPVHFTSTNRWGFIPDDEDDVYTVAEFRELCEDGSLVDYDGFGYPVRDSKANQKIRIRPSEVDQIPEDATHIVWYNR